MKILLLLLALCSPACAATWTLDSYLKEVYSVSHDLKTAQEGVELSRSSYLSELVSFYMPAVTLNVSNTPYSSANSPRLSFNRNKTTAGVSASLNLFNNFKDKLGLDSAKLDRDGSEISLFSARQDLTISALSAYYSVLRQGQLLKVARASLVSYEEQYKMVQAYYKDGLKSYSDVLKSELNFRSSELSSMSYAESYRNSVMAFNALIYREPEEEVELAEVTGVSDLSMPDLRADLDYALANRPDLQKARLVLKQKEIAGKIAYIGWFPDVSVDANYSRNGLPGVGGEITEAQNPYYSAGLSISLPIGPGTYSDINANLSARIALAVSRRALQDSELTAKREIITAWHSRELALKSYDVAKMTAEISAQNLAIMKEKYADGKASMIELDDAQNDDLNSQNNLANSFYDLLLNRASYDKTAGRKIWR